MRRGLPLSVDHTASVQYVHAHTRRNSLSTLTAVAYCGFVFNSHAQATNSLCISTLFTLRNRRARARALTVTRTRWYCSTRFFVVDVFVGVSLK